MVFIFHLFVFILGAIIGSFLNVVILRYGTKSLAIGSRSKCFSCGNTLGSQDLIPVFSFLSLRGSCRYCGSKISLQYPVVELFTAITFSLVFLKFGLNVETIFYWVVWSLFIIIFVYDLKHKIIPDAIVYSLIFLGLIRIILFFVRSPETLSQLSLLPDVSTSSLLTILAGPILFAPFALLWLVSGGKWMGFGDAKIAFALGWLLGFVGGLSAVIFAFWLGAIVGLILISLSKVKVSKLPQKFKNLTIKSEVPFAPFLILGAAIVFFLNINILNFFNII